MADAQGDSQERSRQTFVGGETETFDTRGKAAIPLDYSIGSHGVDVNMEAPISTEDLARAGGLGARDDLASPMPTTVDATDFEESLMDAREYEDKKEMLKQLFTSIPGLVQSISLLKSPAALWCHQEIPIPIC